MPRAECISCIDVPSHALGDPGSKSESVANRSPIIGPMRRYLN